MSSTVVEFRQEAITNLAKVAKYAASTADQAMQLLQSGGGNSEPDDVEPADSEVVENLLNYDEYDFSDCSATTTYFSISSCSARKYKDGTMRFFCTITTKTFPAFGIAAGVSEEAVISSDYLSASSQVLLKQMGNTPWVVINSNGLSCMLSSFSACSPNEQYVVATEISAEDVEKLTIASSVSKESVELTLPEGTTAYDYTYDLTSIANSLLDNQTPTMTLTSLKAVIRNYDRYYVRFSYSGTFTDAHNASQGNTLLSSDYFNSSTEIYTSPSSSTGDSNVSLAIYPTIGVYLIPAEAVDADTTFTAANTLICPLNATMTINTSSATKLESSGGTLKMGTIADLKSSVGQSRIYQVSTEKCNGSVYYTQEQHGVSVILSASTSSTSTETLGELKTALENVPLPLSFAPNFEADKILKQQGSIYLGSLHFGQYGSDVELAYNAEKGLVLTLTKIEGSSNNEVYFAYGCVRGFVPTAYLQS